MKKLSKLLNFTVEELQTDCFRDEMTHHTKESELDILIEKDKKAIEELMMMLGRENDVSQYKINAFILTAMSKIDNIIEIAGS